MIEMTTDDPEIYADAMRIAAAENPAGFEYLMDVERRLGVAERSYESLRLAVAGSYPDVPTEKRLNWRGARMFSLRLRCDTARQLLGIPRLIVKTPVAA